MAKIKEVQFTDMEWRHVPDYEGLYMVNNYGEILRVRRKDDNLLTGGGSIFPSLILKAKLGNSGYYELQLIDKDGVAKMWLVHRVVAKAFLDADKNPGLVVNHKDGNKKNNSVSNLELVTPKENTLHAIATGLRKPRKLTAEQVSELFYDFDNGMKRVELAFKYHVHIDTIDKWLRDYRKGNVKWLEK